MAESRQPIRILHVLGTLNMGGAESRIMDLYRHIDRSRVQFDFLVHYNGERPKQYYDDEVKSLGGNIYVTTRFTGRNLGAYKTAMQSFFEKHHDFAAVEGHMTSMAAVYLPIAKKCGVPVTIAHARSAGVDAGIKGLVTRFFRRNLAAKCDYMLTCSNAAGISVFGEKAMDSGKVIFAPNAIDTRQYAFSKDTRHKIRKELGISDNCFVIGHVGRFDPVKNQTFLAKTAGLMKENSSCQDHCFLFVGEGAGMEECRDIFENAGIADRAIFAGVCNRERTAAMYQAMDIFTLPSLYEGLPGTVIEALSAGLGSVISGNITDEVCLTEDVIRLPIEDTNADAARLWAQRLSEEAVRSNGRISEEEADNIRLKKSQAARKILEEHGYDINVSALTTQKWYEDLAKCAESADI